MTAPASNTEPSGSHGTASVPAGRTDTPFDRLLRGEITSAEYVGDLDDRALMRGEQDMRTGPRAYTAAQSASILRAVRRRRPLPEPALPLEDQPTDD